MNQYNQYAEVQNRHVPTGTVGDARKRIEGISIKPAASDMPTWKEQHDLIEELTQACEAALTHIIKHGWDEGPDNLYLKLDAVIGKVRRPRENQTT